MRKDRQKQRFREVVSGWPGDRGTARSLSALLDVCADEVFGVLFQNIVDLVEQIVGLLGQLLATLLARGRAGGGVVPLPPPPPAFGLLLTLPSPRLLHGG